VLLGRDDDVLALAQLKERLTALRPALPVGLHRLALVLDDKWSSREFARDHELPYVASAPADDPAAVEGLLAAYGCPPIAKSRSGNGSRGVRIVFDDAQQAAIARLPG
jgi:pyruvate carboxylase